MRWTWFPDSLIAPHGRQNVGKKRKSPQGGRSVTSPKSTKIVEDISLPFLGELCSSLFLSPHQSLKPKKSVLHDRPRHIDLSPQLQDKQSPSVEPRTTNDITISRYQRRHPFQLALPNPVDQSPRVIIHIERAKPSPKCACLALVFSLILRLFAPLGDPRRLPPGVSPLSRAPVASISVESRSHRRVWRPWNDLLQFPGP